ncbi:MAG: OsmC family protein [Cyclobacteriaceae bacterium]|nr:OsmC family protein [Cyclobacteriaceae bacterium]
MESSEILSATATIGHDLYLTKLEARSHAINADEPTDAGGKDLGPRPGDFVRMGLASCTAITLRMYANRKGFDVQQIRVKVSNGPFTTKTSYSTDIEITGTLSEDQEARMLQIAKLCPVHKILTNPIEIETQLRTLTGKP